MSRDTLQKIIGDFDLHRFKRFFSEKNRKFKESSESLDYLTDGMFSGVQKLGTLTLDDGSLIVCAIEVRKELSERSGKKAQYEIGKKILKSTQTDAGIFVFYDKNRAFRFSLIYANYLGKKRDWSSFRRFTYFVSRDLTNKTFIRRIGDGDFSSLEKIKDAFSVEKVTKEFYQDIANWYFWAVDNCRFPKDAEDDSINKNGRNIAVIRLITRMIFIWFMRERGLVPRELFEESNVSAILKNLAADKSTYYRAILQNLFFATLNTRQEERKFRSDVRGRKGYNPDRGNHNVFRYIEQFKSPDKIEKYFGQIPFLNGGLFECLDDKPEKIYIDGFTDVKKHQPDVPNFLFFGPEKKAEFLNEVYNTKRKNYKVRGLLNTLSSYNFTIDENTLDDQDIALDPELLGRVFENLLASYNPETATTARKATGSYYTPREIVDYMVTESLREYFKAHLSGLDELDKRLDQLFSTENSDNPFSRQESVRIVDLIESVRIVDPAVGSGAYPMGSLKKLVFILNKLDPDNEFWKQAQLAAAYSIPDPRIRKDAKNRIEEFFKTKNADYGRKLYLIQKCIYGVDIQEIAVEIAKLRFFISLLVDEKINSSTDNMGIEPLPNLDFKIMQGNSLISEFMGIDFDNGQGKNEKNGQAILGIGLEDEGLIKEFERKKFEFQGEPDRDKKAALRNQIEDLMIKIFEARLKRKYADLRTIEDKARNIPNLDKRQEYIGNEKSRFFRKHGIDLRNVENQLRELTGRIKTRSFFPWKLYFAEVFEKGGFDIVIANPPYLESRHSSFDRGLKNALREAIEKRWGTDANKIQRGADLLIYFLELAIYLVCPDGIVVFLTQNSWLDTEYGRQFQIFLLDHTNVRAIVDSDFKYFDARTGPNINTVISIFTASQRTKDSKVVFARFHKDLLPYAGEVLSNTPRIETEIADLKQFDYGNEILRTHKWGMLLAMSDTAKKLLEKLDRRGKNITDLGDSRLLIGQGLNLTKDYLFDHKGVCGHRELRQAIIPILSSADGAPFRVSETKFCLLDSEKVSLKAIRNMGFKHGKLFDPNKTSKLTPCLILPRGIGRHYCAWNEIGAYSASGVDIYVLCSKNADEILLRLWLFLNSSPAWLLREIAGRKNLGGGMLKAEAVDLKQLPIYFEIPIPPIKKLFDAAIDKRAGRPLDEIRSDFHRKIDELVFTYLEIEGTDRQDIVNDLAGAIGSRQIKSRT